MKKTSFIQHYAQYLLCTLAMLVTFVGTAWGDDKIVGNTDNSSGWWTAFSKCTTIGLGGTCNISFTNYGSSDQNFHNWILVANNKEGHNGQNIADFKEYFVLRADNYGWDDYYQTPTLKCNNGDVNWDTFKSDMEKAEVVMDVTYNEDYTISVNATYTNADKSRVYTYKFTSKEIDHIKSISIFNTVENAHLENYTVSGPYYDVNYNLNGHGNAIANVTNVTALPAPLPTTTADGYAFGGWYTDEDLTTAAIAGTTISTNTTLYAKWTATHSVTYNTNGATSTAPTQTAVAEGETFTIADAPTRGGYTFAGWNDGTTTYNAGATYTVGSSDVKLTAQWTMNSTSYKVTYDISGGTSAVPTQANVPVGGNFSLASAPTRYGYSFTGWKDGDDNTWAANYLYPMPAKDVTFTAQWTIAKGKTVNFDGNGKTLTVTSLREPYNVFEQGVLLPAGYTEAKDITSTSSWKRADNANEQTDYTGIVINGTVDEYQQAYFTKDASSVSEGNVIWKEETGFEKGTYEIVISVGASYTEGNPDVQTCPTGNDLTYAFAQDVEVNIPVVKRQWISNGQQDKVALTVEVTDDGKLTYGIKNKAASGNWYIIKVESIKQIVKDNTFLGWYTAATGGKKVGNAGTRYIITGGETLYAHWSHTVTYDNNGATSDNPTQDPVEEGGTFTLADAPSYFMKSFLGWSDGTNTYAAGAEYTVGKADITLTAQWGDATNKTVNFDANGDDKYVTTASLTEPYTGQGIILPSAYEAVLNTITAPTGSTNWTFGKKTDGTEVQNKGNYTKNKNGDFQEAYYTGEVAADDVLTQEIKGLSNGTYEVELMVAASQAWWDSPTGNNLTKAFVNDVDVFIPAIKNRTDVFEGDENTIVFTITITDGTLKYGIKNVNPSCNWYIIRVASIKKINQGSFAGWYTAATGGTRVGGAGDAYTITGGETLYAHWGYSSTNSVVVDHSTTSYQVPSGSSYSCVVKGDIESASVTTDGVVTWTLSEDNDNTSGGGAIVVNYTDGDGNAQHFVITVPYTYHMWFFGNLANHPNVLDDMKMRDSNNNIEKNVSELKLNYKVRSYNEDNTLATLSVPVISPSAAVTGDNAYYMTSTAGFVCNNATTDLRFGIGAEADITFTDGETNTEKLARSWTTANGAYYFTMSQTTLTIPGLKKGQHVRIQWKRYAGQPKSASAGDEMTASNLTDLVGTLIDGFFYVGNIVYSDQNMTKERGGYEEFIVNEDGDVSFTNHDNGWVHLQSITVGDDTHLVKKVTDGDETTYGEGDDDKFIDTDYNVSTDAAYNADGRYHTLPYINIPSGNTITLHLTSNSGNVVCVSSLSNQYTLTGATRGITITKVDDVTYTINALRNGYITIIQKASDANGYVLDYNVQRPKISITDNAYISQTFSQTYPFSWDFTNISAETVNNLAVASKVDDDDVPLTEYTTWGYNETGKYYGIRLIDDFIQGAALAISKEDSYERLEEFQGLGIKANADAQVRIYPDGDGLEFASIDGKDNAHIIIPTVPAGYKAFIRGKITSDAPISAKCGGTSLEVAKMFDSNIGDDGDEQIYVITGVDDSDIDVDLKGIKILKIGVTGTFKQLSEYNGASYATDCQPYDVKYDLTGYFTNEKFPLYGYKVNAASGTNVQFANIAVAPYVYNTNTAIEESTTGTILRCNSTDDSGDIGGVKISAIPLFVRDVNTNKDEAKADVADNKLVGVTKATQLQSTDNHKLYIFTYWYAETDADDKPTGEYKKGDLGFYRQYKGVASTLKANKAYLDLGATSNAKKAYLLWDMFGDDEATDISGTTKANINYETDVVYNLQGVRVTKPTRGIYIVNGKKVVIK